MNRVSAKTYTKEEVLGNINKAVDFYVQKGLGREEAALRVKRRLDEMITLLESQLSWAGLPEDRKYCLQKLLADCRVMAEAMIVISMLGKEDTAN